MSDNDIQNYLPHRYPFLLIDKILDFKKHDFLKAQKNVSNNEPFFQGHFPGHPVFPGVLILEAMAQATALLDFKSNEREKDSLLYYFVGIDKARFKKPVVPGDIMIIDVKLNQSKRDVHKFTASCMVDETIVCTAELLGAVRAK
ncbi:MAG: 3-hydroxyacyl-[acyl-carrier-protein] dehydratase [Gammaproteobacteria bacterium]|jgi:3-hydroxyacyl-[acyl-carrier-protein] dehydratase|tara:strand:- start:2582 stop:3013 length:432 start_codon:yes stop_codon:yes gene_type:complete